jgi:hypothetical protein
VSGDGAAVIGATATLVATPNAGFTFTNWTESGTPVSSLASYSFTASVDRTLVANFAAVPGYSPPTVIMSSAAPSPTHLKPISVTVAFSKAVTGFVAGAITPTNGVVTNFTGSGATYSFNLTPAAPGLVAADIAGGAAQDSLGAPNTAAPKFVRIYELPKGDVNNDNKIDAVDVQLTINAALGIGIGGLNADVNNDGKVDAVDIQITINSALGL